jgi:hypothetical protein
LNNAIKNALLLTSGLAIGGVAGYFATKKMLEVKFENELSEQISEVKEYYKLLRKEDEFSTPETVPTVNYEKIIKEYSQETDEEETDVDEPESVEEVEYTEEVEERNTDLPYIISVEEFMLDRPNYDKNTVTYFDVDDVLCDEREQVIPDVENMVGNEAFTKFGEKSGDTKVVYVRNEKLEMDFEIILDTRSYSEVVLGFKDDEEVRRMREDD